MTPEQLEDVRAAVRRYATNVAPLIRLGNELELVGVTWDVHCAELALRVLLGMEKPDHAVHARPF